MPTYTRTVGAEAREVSGILIFFKWMHRGARELASRKACWDLDERVDERKRADHGRKLRYRALKSLGSPMLAHGRLDLEVGMLGIGCMRIHKR